MKAFEVCDGFLETFVFIFFFLEVLLKSFDLVFECLDVLQLCLAQPFNFFLRVVSFFLGRFKPFVELLHVSVKIAFQI